MVEDSSDIDDLLSDEFLDSLDDGVTPEINKQSSSPKWVVDDAEHTTFKVWKTILLLQEEKEANIKQFGKIANNKTPKSLYKINKTDVASIVGPTPQSIFQMSKFSEQAFNLLKDTNKELYKLHTKEQVKQCKRRKSSGVRSKNKNELVDEIQELRNQFEELQKRSVKETLDLAVQNMPIDLRIKLGM